MNENFLLMNGTSQSLYNQFAKQAPIIDYHCHINPKDIACDTRYDNITQVWLYGDHYKWRQMRINGIDEKYITGDGTDYEKFEAFAGIMPRLIGNPLYNWCYLELKRYFNIDLELNRKNASVIWEKSRQVLKTMPVKKIISLSNVKVICTTDDPCDSLEWHQKIREDKSFRTTVLPAFRPDKAVNIEKDGYITYIKKLSDASGIQIETFTDLKNALLKRLDYFCEFGCVAADHGLDYVPFELSTVEETDKIFKKSMQGETISSIDADKFKTSLLLFLAFEYSKRNIVMELHFGVARNINTQMYHNLGPDTGYDAISGVGIKGLPDFLNTLDLKDSLPKTILYSINPADNDMISTICGCFSQTGIKAKVQQGSAWWFNDTKTGMENQIRSFSNLSTLGCFVGMLTDSRSFLSYTRHEYFRRILCNYIGELIEKGEYTQNDETGSIIEDICFHNAVEFFGLEKYV